MTSSPVTPLFTRSLKGWFSAKGFWLVVAAALLPLILTGAWVVTHRADVEVTSIAWDATTLQQGQNVTFTALVKNAGSVGMDGFNVSFAVGTASGNTLFPLATQEERIDHLGPGETREVKLSWNATPGILYAVATADSHDTPGHEGEGEIGEIDELNNQLVKPLAVANAPPDPATAPPAPSNLTGDANATLHADLEVVSVSEGEGPVRPGDARTITATVTNHGPDAVTGANVTVRVGQDFGGTFFPAQETTALLDLAPGETKTATLSWSPTTGAYWEEAFVLPPADATDPDGANNHATKTVTADAQLPPDLADIKHTPKFTIKIFYIDFLQYYLRLVVPLIALFYAAGVIADERDRKVLTYILTKPTPRWVFPITKFVASFLVGAVAVTIGMLATYALLFGTTPDASDVGFLTTPLFATLLSLFAYGALFTLVGVYFDHPFLVGIVFIAWEAIDVPFEFTGAVLNALALQPWMQHASVAKHLLDALRAWPADKGVLWLPTGDGGTTALLILVGIAVGSLVAAAVVMRRKEFRG